MEGNHIIALTRLLDPRFKKLPFADQSVVDLFTSLLVSEASREYSQQRQTQPPQHQAAKNQDDIMWDFFD